MEPFPSFNKSQQLRLPARSLASFRAFLMTFVFLACVSVAPGSSTVEVLLPKGRVLGRLGIVTRSGRIIHSFLGIPYAEPPVDALRLRDPVPKQPWTGVLNATVNGPQCPQKNVYTLHAKFETVGQEDCLHLNVYTPEVISEPKYPVMVYIHGGSFQQGSNYRYIYGPEFILDKNVVLVTINYRLAALGFLSLGDDVLPGNSGLKDQALALQWVSENIKFFGGNHDLVTLFGDSAGAASASLHMFSPLSKGLFHRAISMSGTGLCPWAMIPQPQARDRARAFAALVGCPTEPSVAVLECLQITPLEAILEAQLKFYEWLFLPVVVFGPVIENGTNGFLVTNPRTDPPESAVPWIAGISSGEGGVVASALFSRAPRYIEELQLAPDWILPVLLTLRSRFARSELPVIAEQVKQFYFGDSRIDASKIPEFIDMVTDNWFMFGSMSAATKWGSPSYFYYYDYQTSRSYNEIFGNGSIKSVSHSDILLNLFPLTAYFRDRVMTEEEKIVSHRIVNLWTDFASGAVWGVKENDWQPVKSDSAINYLYIGKDEPVMKENLLRDRYQFWRALEELETGKLTVII